MKQEVKIGQTDYTVLILIRDTAGAPKTGLTNASGGIDVCYTRVETDNDVVLTDGAVVALATPALTDVHLDWGLLEVNATKAPGIYRLDIADGVFATGAWSAVVSLICTGCDPVHMEFVLVPESPYVGVRADAYSISGSATAANNLEASSLTIVVGAAAAGTLSTTQMTTDLTEATNDHYNGRIVIWTSGVLINQATDITDYDGASKMLTFTAVTEAPTAADTFVIV